MANKVWPATVLTGGGTGALDGIDGANLTEDEHVALVITSSGVYLYYLDHTSGATENSPYVIAPYLNAGDKRWILQDIYTSGGLVIDQSSFDTHAATSDAHHSRYTDSEAQTAVDNHLSGDDGITYTAGSITVDSTVLRNTNLESSGGNIVDKFQTETQPGQKSQAIPVTNSEGYLDQSWIHPVYGVRWDSVNDTYQAGLVIGGTFVATGYSPFPVQEKMGRGLLTTDGRWTKLDSNDSSKLLDGSSATLDGSAGQVMVKVPRHYQLAVKDGDYRYFLCSEQPFSFQGVNAWIPPAFLGYENVYVGAFQGVALSDSTSANLGSVVLDTSGYSNNTNPNPYTNQTRPGFRSYCSNTGEPFCQWSYGIYEMIYILAFIEYKTWALQEQIEGYTENGSGDYNYTSQAGETLSLGDYSGSVGDGSSSGSAMSYRGIENFFGNVWQWVDGINIDTDDNQRVYVTFDPADFADDTTTNYIDTGIAPAFNDEDNYQKDIHGKEQYSPTWPIELNNGADSSSYITDFFWSNASGSGWRVVRVGGRLDAGRQAGFGDRGSDTSSSDSHSDGGSRLAAYV